MCNTTRSNTTPALQARYAEKLASLPHDVTPGYDGPTGTFGTIDACLAYAARRSAGERRTAFIFRHTAPMTESDRPNGPAEWFEVHTDAMLGRARGGTIAAFVSCTLHVVT